MNFSHIVLSDVMLYFYDISSVSLLLFYVSILVFIPTVQQSHKAWPVDNKSTLVNLDLTFKLSQKRLIHQNIKKLHVRELNKT